MLVSELIEATRNLIFGGQREERNKLASSVTSSATSLLATYPLSQITRGSKLSIDLEDMYVWDASGLTIGPTDRGQWGSLPAAHSANANIHVNPKFSNWEIFNAINNEVVSLSAPNNGLYHVQTTELTYNPNISGYAYADTNLLSVLEVRHGVYGPSMEFTLSRNWDFSSDLATEFTTGAAIFVRDAIPGRPVIIKGKFAFSQLPASLSADTSSTGIPDTAIDILPLGAAWQLTTSVELTRNFSSAQGDTRRAQEVPPGAALGGARELGRRRDIRIREEAARLNERYPNRADRFPYRASYA